MEGWEGTGVIREKRSEVIRDGEMIYGGGNTREEIRGNTRVIIYQDGRKLFWLCMRGRGRGRERRVCLPGWRDGRNKRIYTRRKYGLYMRGLGIGREEEGGRGVWVYLDGCATEDRIDEHILLAVPFHLQQPTRVALNEIQKWT